MPLLFPEGWLSVMPAEVWLGYLAPNIGATCSAACFRIPALLGTTSSRLHSPLLVRKKFANRSLFNSANALILIAKLIMSVMLMVSAVNIDYLIIDIRSEGEHMRSFCLGQYGSNFDSHQQERNVCRLQCKLKALG